MSGYKPEILFLKQEDVVAAGLLDMKMILEVTEKTFKMIGEGQVINPPKTMLGMPNVENWTSFCMSMPSYIGGDVDIVDVALAFQYNMIGIKIYAVAFDDVRSEVTGAVGTENYFLRHINTSVRRGCNLPRDVVK